MHGNKEERDRLDRIPPAKRLSLSGWEPCNPIQPATDVEDKEIAVGPGTSGAKGVREAPPGDSVETANVGVSREEPSM